MADLVNILDLAFKVVRADMFHLKSANRIKESPTKDSILHSSYISAKVASSVCILLECQKSTLRIVSEFATSINTLLQYLPLQLYCGKTIVKVNVIIATSKGLS